MIINQQTASASPNVEGCPRQRWATPRLEAHASLTVLTQSVLGVLGPILYAQIGCSAVGGCGGPNGQVAPVTGAPVQPGSASAPSHP
jgi:hypothetical protein